MKYAEEIYSLQEYFKQNLIMFILCEIMYKRKKLSASLTHPQEPVWLTGNAEPEAAQQVDDIHVGTAKAGCARVGEM